MTEDEAKTKRCCGPVPHNTGTFTEAESLPGATGFVCLCSGSRCMAWIESRYFETDDGKKFQYKPDNRAGEWKTEGWCSHTVE